jgi:hypothetical protein
MTTPPIYFSAGSNYSPWKEYLYIFMHKPPWLKPDRVFFLKHFRLKIIVDFGALLIGAKDARSSEMHSHFLRAVFI